MGSEMCIRDRVVTVYDDVDPALHEWAKLSMLAHLIKLDREAQAREVNGLWQCVQ